MADGDESSNSQAGSLLQSHLRLHGLAAGEVNSADLLEAQRARGFKKEPRVFKPWLYGAALAASLLLGLVWSGSPQDYYSPRGESGVGFYRQRGGQVVSWTPGQKLLDGDRLQVTVETAEPGFVYLAVVGEEDNLLSNTSWSAIEPIEVHGDGINLLPYSIELVPPAQQESLKLWVCSVAHGMEELTEAKLPEDCWSYSYPLR